MLASKSNVPTTTSLLSSAELENQRVRQQIGREKLPLPEGRERICARILIRLDLLKSTLLSYRCS